MKQILVPLMLALCSATYSQTLIGTAESLILVYNFPGSSFYVELPGHDKNTTDRDGCFIIDKKLVQVNTVYKGKFIDSTQLHIPAGEVLQKYITWEKDYLEKTFSFDVRSKVEMMRTAKGRDFAFWTYDMPTGDQPVRTDTTETLPTRRQLFVLAVVGDYVTGVNTPLFEANGFIVLRKYLLACMDGLVESKEQIDPDELNRKVNKQ